MAERSHSPALTMLDAHAIMDAAIITAFPDIYEYDADMAAKDGRYAIGLGIGGCAIKDIQEGKAFVPAQWHLDTLKAFPQLSHSARTFRRLQDTSAAVGKMTNLLGLTSERRFQ